MTAIILILAIMMIALMMNMVVTLQLGDIYFVDTRH